MTHAQAIDKIRDVLGEMQPLSRFTNSLERGAAVASAMYYIEDIIEEVGNE